MDLKEINILTQTVPNSMNKIEWWLLKYSDQFIEIENVKHSYELDAGFVVKRPLFLEVTENQTFLGLFNALNNLSNFHRFENYFKEQMSDYKNIKSSQVGLKEWLSKNEELGSDKFVCFLIDYLDYDLDDKVEHLKVYVHEAINLDVYVDRADFKNTIEFLEAFNELYWTNESSEDKL